MRDHSSLPSMHWCTYCGQWHMYSEEMCRDMRKQPACDACPHRLAASRDQWVSVKERLPKFDDPVLAVWDGDVIMATVNSEVGNWQEYPDGDFAIGDEVTHWLPLPPAPKEMV